ncbi:MAG: Wzz/FepE/Etk N-terminal domain-containing protein [Anaerolineae bacterium]
MDLVAFARMIAFRGWIVLLFAVAGAGLGYAYAAAQTPVYEASTAVRLQPARPADLGQTNAIKEAMRSYQRDIKTFDLADAVHVRLCGDDSPTAQQLCAETTGESLRGMIYVGMDPNVFEIDVKARATDPAVAVKVSEQAAHAFVDRRDKANAQLELRERILADVRDEPQPELYSPRRKLIVGAGAVLGAFLGGLLVLLLEYLQRAVVRDSGEAEQIAGAPVLGALPPSAVGKKSSKGASRSWGALRAGLADMAGPARRYVAMALPVVVLALVGAAAAYGFSRAQQQVFVARTHIAVEPALGSDWGQSLAIREIARGFSRDITTRRMASKVSERLQADLTPDAMLEKVNVAEDVDVYEITIEALDPIAANAEAISREWAEVFVEELRIANLERDQRDRVLTRLRDRTLVEVWAPKTRANVLAGAVLGAIAGALAAFGFQLVRSGLVLSPADASRYAGATVVGVIPPDERGRRSTTQTTS